MCNRFLGGRPFAPHHPQTALKTPILETVKTLLTKELPDIYILFIYYENIHLICRKLPRSLKKSKNLRELLTSRIIFGVPTYQWLIENKKLIIRFCNYKPSTIKRTLSLAKVLLAFFKKKLLRHRMNFKI